MIFKNSLLLLCSTFAFKGVAYAENKEKVETSTVVEEKKNNEAPAESVEKPEEKTEDKTEASAGVEGKKEETVDQASEATQRDEEKAKAFAIARKSIARQDTGGTDSIKAALESAYKNNPDLAAEVTKVNQEDEKMVQAKAGFRPHIQGTVSVGADKKITSGGEKDQGLEVTTRAENIPLVRAAVEVNQNLYSGGATVASVKVAENSIKVARANLLSLEQNIFIQVIEVILNIITKNAELDLYVGDVKALQQTLDATNAKFTAGELSLTDVAQAQAQLSEREAQVETAKAELEGLKANFEKLTGRKPGKLVKPDIAKNFPETLEKAIQIARENNPGIIQSMFAEAAARYDVDRIGGGLLPSVDLKGSLSRTEDKTFAQYTNAFVPVGANKTRDTRDGYTDMSASVTVSVPIYEQGTIRSQKRAAHEAAAGARIQTEIVRRKVVEQLIAYWETYVASRANIESYKAQIAARKIAFEGQQQEMEVGTKVVLDVLNAQRDLLQAQLSLVRGQHNYLLSSFQVLLGMGRLTAKQMGLKVTYYDPSIHYNSVKSRF